MKVGPVSPTERQEIIDRHAITCESVHPQADVLHPDGHGLDPDIVRLLDRLELVEASAGAMRHTLRKIAQLSEIHPKHAGRALARQCLLHLAGPDLEKSVWKSEVAEIDAGLRTRESPTRRRRMNDVIAAIFTEWQRQFQEAPEKFLSDAGQPDDYGTAAARMFRSIAAELDIDDAAVLP